MAALLVLEKHRSESRQFECPLAEPETEIAIATATAVGFQLPQHCCDYYLADSDDLTPRFEKHCYIRWYHPRYHQRRSYYYCYAVVDHEERSVQPTTTTDQTNAMNEDGSFFLFSFSRGEEERSMGGDGGTNKNRKAITITTFTIQLLLSVSHICDMQKQRHPLSAFR